MQKVSVEKDEGRERPVPTVWRSALKQVADAFVLGDLSQVNASATVDRIAPETGEINRRNIEDYPDALGPLTEKTWDTSVYIWMGDHWQVLVDLSSVGGETSDLVLHAKIREIGDHFTIEPGLIYVP